MLDRGYKTPVLLKQRTCLFVAYQHRALKDSVLSASGNEFTRLATSWHQLQAAREFWSRASPAAALAQSGSWDRSSRTGQQVGGEANFLPRQPISGIIHAGRSTLRQNQSLAAENKHQREGQGHLAPKQFYHQQTSLPG